MNRDRNADTQVAKKIQKEMKTFTLARKRVKEQRILHEFRRLKPPDSAISLRSLRASDGIAQKPAEGGPDSARLDPDPQKRTVVLSCPIQMQIILTQLLARV